MSKNRQKPHQKAREPTRLTNHPPQPIKATKKASNKPERPKKILREEKLEQKNQNQEIFPSEFPFWARLKIEKKRPTLVIDEEMVVDKKSKKLVEGYVHRELISTYKKGREILNPNPDKTKKEPAYLKPPKKTPKRLFKKNNKDLDMPQHLKERYSKNNKK